MSIVQQMRAALEPSGLCLLGVAPVARRDAAVVRIHLVSLPDSPTALLSEMD